MWKKKGACDKLYYSLNDPNLAQVSNFDLFLFLGVMPGTGGKMCEPLGFKF